MLRGCIPLLILAIVLVQAQQNAPIARALDGVSIPAELTTTIRAEKAHRGDPVQFRTLESVLIANGLVMPANTKLEGRIVGAAARQGNKPSWLVLLVERAEWKQQSIALHAFISGQIEIRNVALQTPESVDGMMTNGGPRQRRRENVRNAVESGADISPSTRLPTDSKTSSQPDMGAKELPLKDLRIVRDKNGIAYLFSPKSNVKLSSGTLLMLQNQGRTELAGREAGGSTSPSSVPQ